MPRAPRIEFAGAIYHVMNRGDHLEPIYQNDQDREIFLKTLGETCGSTGWFIHSFVLMKNHYHLLLETPRPNLVRGMQYLNSTYTQRYNSRHKTRGHLFQGRYKALIVDGESENYFLTVSDYIHMNPVRIRQVKTLSELLKDPWNSAEMLTARRKKQPVWLQWQRIYGELGHHSLNRKARQDFRKHLEEQIEAVADQKGWDKIRRGWCLGSKAFLERMKDRLGNLLDRKPNNENWRGEPVEEAEEQRATRLLAKALRCWKLDHPHQVKGQERYLLAMWLRDHSGVSNGWLCKTFGLKTTGGIRNGITLVRCKFMNHKQLRKRWQQLAAI
jgi:REP element-mobilizing transposase RayT